MATTLLKIKNHMVNYFSDMETDDDDYYSEYGHCGGKLLSDIKIFWNKFSTNEDFIYVVSGRWASDDLDLDGARDYFFTHSKVIPMLFDYLYNILGYSKKRYRDCIYNSIEFTDDLLDMYDNPAIIRDSRINEILEDDIINEILEDDIIDDMPKNDVIVLKYPKSMKEELDLNPNFKFIGFSKVDRESPIYSIYVPKGYLIVPELNEALK